LKGVYSGIPWPQGSGLLRAAVLRGVCAHGGPPYTAVSTQMMHPMAPDGIARTISGSGVEQAPLGGRIKTRGRPRQRRGAEVHAPPLIGTRPGGPGAAALSRRAQGAPVGVGIGTVESAFPLERFSALTYFPQPASCTKPYAGVLFRGVLNLLPNRV
jgi:hypothetical protein